MYNAKSLYAVLTFFHSNFEIYWNCIPEFIDCTLRQYTSFFLMIEAFSFLNSGSLSLVSSFLHPSDNLCDVVAKKQNPLTINWSSATHKSQDSKKI